MLLIFSAFYQHCFGPRSSVGAFIIVRLWPLFTRLHVSRLHRNVNVFTPHERFIFPCRGKKTTPAVWLKFMHIVDFSLLLGLFQASG